VTDNQAVVVVFGSVNADLHVHVEHIPRSGQTILARPGGRSPGGKSANQAVAAARYGARTHLLCGIGDDPDGTMLTAAINQTGVHLHPRTSSEPSGLAIVMVSADGDNAIIVVPGSNHALAELTESDRLVIDRADVLLCQLETPISGVGAAAAYAHDKGIPVMLNAAPVQPVPDHLRRHVDVLIVNEHEAVELAQTLIASPMDNLEAALHVLADVYPTIVTTCGPAGAIYTRTGQPALTTPAPIVNAVDTTGAGDTFCGVLAAGVAAGVAVQDAIATAITAASLSVQQRGAMTSIPTRGEIDAAQPTT